MWRWLGLIAVLSWALPMIAQVELTEIYVQPDAFVIDYPSGWQVETDAATGFVTLVQEELRLTLYSPAVLDAFGFENYNPATLLQLLVELNDVVPGNLETLDPFMVQLAYERDEIAGLLIARTFSDGSVGVIDAFGPPDVMREYEERVLLVAATFDVPPVPAPETLVDYAGRWPESIAELETAGLIAPGGDIVFVERYVFASGRNRIQPLAQTLSITNVVIAGNLLLTPSTEPISDRCALLAQINGDDMLEVGLNISGEVYQIPAERILQSNVDTSSQHRVLLLMLDERLLVYLDGVLVGDEEIVPNSGYFGIKAQGGVGTMCEVTDLWVYRVPHLEPGQCDILAARGGVNRRVGPGMAFAVVGVLDAGASQSAVAQATGSDGLTWWQLETGGWVRDDVVQATNVCRSLPVDE